MENTVRADAKLAGAPRESGQAVREDAILEWLRSKNVEDSWHIAPELAELGVPPPDQLDQLSGSLSQNAITVVLSQFASSLRSERIADAMLNSTAPHLRSDPRH